MPLQWIQHHQLINWGKAIKAQFDVDNLHMTGMLDRAGYTLAMKALMNMEGGRDALGSVAHPAMGWTV